MITSVYLPAVFSHQCIASSASWFLSSHAIEIFDMHHIVRIDGRIASVFRSAEFPKEDEIIAGIAIWNLTGSREERQQTAPNQRVLGKKYADAVREKGRTLREFVVVLTESYPISICHES